MPAFEILWGVTVLSRDALVGRWTHAHEEDTEDETVFRPADQPLPPARGRRSLELRRDGSYAEVSPGPVDVPEESAGHWALDGDRLLLRPKGDRPSEAWGVSAAESDRLLLRRAASDP